MLEQNYRSTQTILNAANAVIVQNEGRKPKRLWSDAGDGERIVGYVADTEHDEAQFVATEIDRLSDAGSSRYGDVAVFYRTNAQSRAFEEVFIRVGLPYKVVGGVRFYERREIRDAIGYLRAIANRTDDVSVRRIINVPKRGIGDRAEGAVAELAARERISFGEALRRVDEIDGLASRSAQLLTEFAAFLDAHEAMVADGDAGRPDPDQRAGEVRLPGPTLQRLRRPPGRDPAGEPGRADRRGPGVRRRAPVARARRRNLTHRAAAGLGPADRSRDWAGRPASQRRTSTSTTDPEFDLAAGAPEPDPSLGAFLERVALVADSDQIPRPPGVAGVVTLMTLHTAKGLEFDTVFLTGLEDAVFPHQRALAAKARAGGGAAVGLRRDHPGTSAALPDPRRGPVGLGCAAAQSRRAASWTRSRTGWWTGAGSPVPSPAGGTPRPPARPSRNWRTSVGDG